MAFVRCIGKTCYLVHNVRRQGKIRQLHLARLGDQPRITDDVVRNVTRNYPTLKLDWTRLREKVNRSRAENSELRSGFVRKLIHSISRLNLDLWELSPSTLRVAHGPAVRREMTTQLRLLHSNVEDKLNQFTQSPRAGLPRRLR